MAIEGDIWQNLVKSPISNSEEVNQSEDVLSPEDSAWIDSCLVNDLEVFADNWDDFNDALLDTVSLQPTSSYRFSVSEGEGISRRVHDEHVPMNVEAGSPKYSETVNGNLDSISENSDFAEFFEATGCNLLQMGVYDEHDPMTEKIGASEYLKHPNGDLFSSSENAEFLGATQNNLFPGVANDGIFQMNEEAESSSSKNAESLRLPEEIMIEIAKKKGIQQFEQYLKEGFSSDFCGLEDKEDNNVEEEEDTDKEMKFSREDIFKVWDLDSCTEEDELEDEFEKVLAKGCTTLDDSFDESGKEKYNELISGIANLSLLPSSD